MATPPALAEIVTDLLLGTVTVVIVKEAVVVPAATVTLAGTLARLVLLLDNVTTVPAAGAGPVRITVPVEEAGPLTVLGLSVRVLIAGAATVKVVVLVTA